MGTERTATPGRHSDIWNIGSWQEVELAAGAGGRIGSWDRR